METDNMMPFAFTEGQSSKDKSQNIIKVIGVGGGGSNAVLSMYKQGVHNVRFAICNTDSQALAQADIPVKIQLGSAGLGVGGKPEIGKKEAEASLDAIQSLFEDDTEMVFKGGPVAIAKKNENGMDLVTFLKDYMENGYEIPTDQDYIELDDLVL